MSAKKSLKEPELTVVVPVFKVPYDKLKRCLDSLCIQTDQDFEVILIDDGSPDDCGNICDQYAKEHENFSVIHQENGGLSVVRNNGIAAASGKWICFVDGDDWIEKESIEFAKEYVKQCPDGDVLIWEEIIDTDGILKYNCFFEKPIEGILCFEGKETRKIIDRFLPRYYKPLKGEQYTDMGSTLGRLYNVDFLRSNNLKNVPGLKRMQDNVFNLWVFDTAHKVYYQTKHLYHYCFNSESATKKYSPGLAKTFVMLFNSYKDFINVRCTKEEINEFNQRLYIKFIGLFGQLFELDYASPLNEKDRSIIIHDIKEDFSSVQFREVLENVDISGQRFKAKVLYYMLKYKMYRLALRMCVLNVKYRPSKRTK